MTQKKKKTGTIERMDGKLFKTPWIEQLPIDKRQMVELVRLFYSKLY